MTVAQINQAIANGTEITFCPWEDAFTNAAHVVATQVGEGREVTYRLSNSEDEGWTKTKVVSYSTWAHIASQA